jgi:hypothetical protein
VHTQGGAERKGVAREAVQQGRGSKNGAARTGRRAVHEPDVHGSGLYLRALPKTKVAPMRPGGLRLR